MIFKKKNNSNEADWLSISDLMSGLMAIFILIAVSYAYIISKVDLNELQRLKNENRALKDQNQKLKNQIAEFDEVKDKINKLANSVDDFEKKLRDMLIEEFRDDLPRWNAEITKNSIFKFNSPDILFEIGKSDLKQEFKDILRDFFPRYIKILKEFDRNYPQSAISEVRIEGHTSPEWNDFVPEKEAFLFNASLSQSRAYKVLEFSMKSTDIYSNFDYLKTRLRANGLSSAKPIYNNYNAIDNYKSRRVEFRAIVETRNALENIKQEIEKIDKLVK